MPGKCPGCGASGDGFICQFCGASLGAVSALQELEALDAFHRVLRDAASDESRETLLRSGFVPSSPTALIEAGLRCIPLTNTEGLATLLASAAFARLELVTTKLRLLPKEDRVDRAAAEFELRLAAVREADRREMRLWSWGCGIVVLALAAAVTAGVIWSKGSG